MIWNRLAVAHRLLGVLDHDVVSAALDDGGGGDKGETGLILQLGDGERTAVAHGGLDLVQGAVHAVLEGAGVGHVGVDALDEGELLGAAQVVALPVAGARGTLAPVLLHVLAVDVHAGRRGLVETGEVTAEHEEVGTHGERKGHVVVVDDAAVGTNRDVYAGLLEVLIAGAADVDQRGGLATADALGLTGDADGTAADTDLDEVGTAIGQEAEAVGVDDVARADLDGIAVVLAESTRWCASATRSSPRRSRCTARRHRPRRAAARARRSHGC